MSDLHGSAPDRSPVVLVLIDVINDLEWPCGQELAYFVVKPMHSGSSAPRSSCSCATSRRARWS